MKTWISMQKIRETDFFFLILDAQKNNLHGM